MEIFSSLSHYSTIIKNVLLKRKKCSIYVSEIDDVTISNRLLLMIGGRLDLSINLIDYIEIGVTLEDNPNIYIVYFE